MSEREASGKAGDTIRNCIGFLSYFAAYVLVAGALPQGYVNIVAWPILAAWFLFDTFAHELGHAVAAKLSGWRVNVFAVGPIAYHLINHDFAILPRKQRQEFGGFVLPSPSSQEVWSRQRHIAISAGGPVANLLLCASLFAWVLWSPSQAYDANQLNVPMFLSALGIASLGTALTNGLPIGSKRHDGGHIASYKTMSDDEFEQWRAPVQIESMLNHQIRLRDLPHWMLDEYRSNTKLLDEHPVLSRVVHTYDVGIILDSPPVNLMQGRKYLDDHLKLYGDSEWLASCDAYFTAIWEKDGPAARSRLWQGEQHDDGLVPLVLAAKAAVAAQLGEKAMATDYLRQMRVARSRRSIFPDYTFRDIGWQIQVVIDGLA